jgi:glycosyltransferase involved in cell wall biosynthesis
VKASAAPLSATALDPAPRPTLGVVAIAFNETRDLPGFLRNLEGWVDEIVIVDDGSSDDTVAIARAAGQHVKVLVSPRAPGEYFSHQRNKGIAVSTSDWLLHMDIDERVSPELAQEVRAAIRRADCDGFRFRRLNYFMHRPMRGGGWQDWNLVHLARREVLRFEGMYHEECCLNLPEPRIGQLDHQMLHFNEDSFEKRLRKSSLYLEELYTRVEKRSRPVGLLDIVGRPTAEFFRRYLLKGGFRDGVPGVISAIHSATALFRANALVWDRQNRVDRSELESEIDQRWKARGANWGAGLQ